MRENDGEHKKHHAKVKKQGILTQQPTGLLASMASTRGGGRRRRKWCCCGARRVGKGRRRKIPLSGCFVEGGGGSLLVCELSEQCPPAERQTDRASCQNNSVERQTDCVTTRDCKSRLQQMSRDMGRVTENRRHSSVAATCRRHYRDMCNIAK